MKKRSNNGLLLSAAGIAIAAGVYDFATCNSARADVSGASDGLPPTMTFNAVIRDFKSAGERGGHPDFEAFSGSDASVGLIQDTLDSDGKPVFLSNYGKSGCAGFTNSAGQRIMPSMADASKGDKVGTLAANTSKQLTSSAAFSQWYRDVAGVNVSKVIPIVLNRVAGTNRYVFDSATDEPYKTRGGFFPINGELYGNYSTTGKNFHFTTEVSAKFVYSKADNAVFTFTGDDDLWVFINNKLVMDLGGLHAKKDQTLEINRVAGLEEGKSYDLKIFHAERHTTESNFRIETTLRLAPVQLPTTTCIFD
ncbi:MAG TPA: fibro-slime domain-containing protein [Phycisphaerales bacterium]|jgi:fibro-slime domain-containing protein|nr:fibro-slime domain-containing protein [Phycisphaerales bacterium]